MSPAEAIKIQRTYDQFISKMVDLAHNNMTLSEADVDLEKGEVVYMVGAFAEQSLPLVEETVNNFAKIVGSEKAEALRTGLTQAEALPALGASPMSFRLKEQLTDRGNRDIATVILKISIFDETGESVEKVLDYRIDANTHPLKRDRGIYSRLFDLANPDSDFYGVPKDQN